MRAKPSEPFLVGVELGGTKSIAVISEGDRIIDRLKVPTGRPEDTLAMLRAAIAAWRKCREIAALGVGSFGPITLDRHSPDYGRMASTPKAGWTGVDVLAPLVEAAGTSKAMLHTDVTAAALAERRRAREQAYDDLIYVTVGTGIGFGVIAGGRPVTGALHPEAGHMRIRRLPGDAFAGVCPFHGDCLEGLAAGPAVAARAGAPAATLAPDSPIWAPVADALAEGIATMMLALSPKVVLIGGGLALGQPQLMPMIRDGIRAKLGGYLPNMSADAIAALVRPARAGAQAGPLGTIALARMALEGSE